MEKQRKKYPTIYKIKKFFLRHRNKKETIERLKELLNTYMHHEHAANIVLKEINKHFLVFEYQVLSSTYLQILPTRITTIGIGGNFIYENSVALDKNLQTNITKHCRQSYLKLTKASPELRRKIKRELQKLANNP